MRVHHGMWYEFGSAMILLACTSLCAPETCLAQDEPPPHDSWTALLERYVNKEGMVDYAGLLRDVKDLDAYLDLLSGHPPNRFWTEDVEKAYWINAYNAFTIKLVLENFPVESIRDIYNGNPWDVQWIRIGDDLLSLNEIEKEKLLGRFGDPRIHFAINCAAMSCPPLMPAAYEADYLDMRLNRRASMFVNNPEYNRLGLKEITISRIFDWYRHEFEPLLPYLNKYSGQHLPQDVVVKFHEYDWALNAR